jgi:hypothetical protein
MPGRSASGVVVWVSLERYLIALQLNVVNDAWMASLYEVPHQVGFHMAEPDYAQFKAIVLSVNPR